MSADRSRHPPCGTTKLWRDDLGCLPSGSLSSDFSAATLTPVEVWTVLADRSGLAAHFGSPRTSRWSSCDGSTKGGCACRREPSRLTKEIMVAEEAPGWRLSAKTDAYHPAGEGTSNWYVGYVEKGGAVYYFALQMGGKDYGRAYSERIPISRAILTELGILN